MVGIHPSINTVPPEGFVLISSAPVVGGVVGVAAGVVVGVGVGAAVGVGVAAGDDVGAAVGVDPDTTTVISTLPLALPPLPSLTVTLTV